MGTRRKIRPSLQAKHFFADKWYFEEVETPPADGGFDPLETPT